MHQINIKFKLTALILLSAIILLSLPSCDRKPSEGFSSDSLCIVYKGTSYKVGQNVKKLLNALGTPDNILSMASCHYSQNGDEHIYEYYFGSGQFKTVSDGDYTNIGRYADLLRIHTVPLKPDADFICDIDCYTSEAATDKGITVGSSMDDIIKAYGDKYYDEGEGFIRYYDGEPLPDSSSLLFYMIDGKVGFFSVSAAINI